jgi:hypothetical protein
MDVCLVIFGHWLQNRQFALSIAGSDWGYPLVQATHFTGLSIWIGTIVAVDVRLLGVGKKSAPTLQFSDPLFIWNWIGFCIAVSGGFLLFSVSAETYLNNVAFLTKLGLLIPLGLVLHVVNQRKAPGWEKASAPP